ncbi:alpha/beta hydrolase [Salinarimonas ramus]|uniref:Alpha/beta hydrolase n=1 Tax=Salinarimonas ramus TaxID=690164 RepID=A0A917QKF2_9HYPH|nr:alpha/beta hydrolase [Salinarimonas ramus]GGK54881.1 alpha/beta hydrolase [Salinarimonas ramus]
MDAAIDYEREYDNRGRVPEHPEIIAGWARDAAAFRETHAPLEIVYGPGERQRIDLFRPQIEKARAAVMFVHGGYWQALDRSYFSHLARGLMMHGIEVAIPSYTLAPQARIGEIVEEMRACAREMARFERPLVVAGHSAGGHLAACLLGTHWKAVSQDLPDDLVRAAYCISGLFDLAPLLHTKVNGALRMDEAQARAASPLLWEPITGCTLDAVVGGIESAEYHRQSRAIVEEWGAKGVATRYEEVPGAHHFDVIAPLADPHSGMVARLLELVRAQR